MEMDNIGSYASSMMAEVHAWSRFEKIFSESVGAEDMQTKQFLKMKLKEFDRIWYSHPNTPGNSTIDERAMQIVVNYQRKKLEKALYPGLLRRLLHRARVYVAASIDGTRSLAKARQLMQGYQYGNRVATGPAANNGQQQAQPGEQPAERRQHYGPNLGGRKWENHQSKSQRM